MKRILAVLPILLVSAAPAHGATLLRLDGIGPLSLGMDRTAAVATNWLKANGHGCPLGGKPYPVAYTVRGPKAPAGIVGSVEFNGGSGRLEDMSFTKGVRTATGVVVGRTTAADMVKRYRSAGFVAGSRYDSTFQGTFVTIRRHKGGAPVLQGFASKSKVDTLGIPTITVCE